VGVREAVLAIATWLAFSGAGEVSEAAYPGENGRIAFTRLADGAAHIMAVNADASGLDAITDGDSFNCCASWSADGTKVAFFSNRSGNNDVWVMNSDGSGLHNVTNHPADEGRASLSPDGKRVAFGSDRDGDFEIFVANADGADVRQLTHNNDFNDYNPAWSPDGSLLAFESNRDGNQEIYVMSASGAAETNLTQDPSEDGEPDWSPDGKRIAFHSTRSGNFDIYAMNADGSAPVLLATDLAADRSPAWSPDGTQVAFASTRGDGTSRIYTASVGGGEAVALTDGGGGMDSDPDWQPRLPLHGDTDCDGDIDSVDGLNVLRDTAGFPPSLCITAGDVDCDGDRDSVDGLGLLRHVAALPPLDTPPGCPQIGEPLAPLAGGVLATFQVIDEEFSVWVRSPATIQQLFDLEAGKSVANIPNGPLLHGPGRGSHNNPWSWHLDPDETAMVEGAIEVCDGRPSYIEDDLSYWIDTLGYYCPWDAELIGLIDYR
jgi:hypothetical protein